MGGLGAEVAKNITLAGIKSLTILDDRNAAAGSANFLVSPDAVGQNVTISYIHFKLMLSIYYVWLPRLLRLHW